MYNKVWWLYLVVGIVLLSSFKMSNDKDEWKLGTDKDGIKVYTKKSEQGKIRTSRAEMFLALPQNRIIDLLSDFDHYANWFPNCREAKVIRKISDNESISHLIYKTPWPLPNVDCVQRMVVDKKMVRDTLYVRVSAEPNYIGPTSGCSRVKLMQGSWQIVAGNGGVWVINTYYSDMGGIIPAWLANTQAVEIPYSIFHSMRDYLRGITKK